MAKVPHIGTTKTRLSPQISPAEAAGLYEALLKDTIALARKLKHIDLAVAFSPSSSKHYFQKISPSQSMLLPVDCDNIGSCLEQVLRLLIEMGYKKAIAINSDGPSLPIAYLAQAFQELEDNDIVLGPNDDGGYYLIGLKRIFPELFSSIDWSTSAVLTQTLERIKQLDQKVYLLPSWYDVDTYADFRRLKIDLERLPTSDLAHTREFLSNSSLISLDK